MGKVKYLYGTLELTEEDLGVLWFGEKKFLTFSLHYTNCDEENKNAVLGELLNIEFVYIFLYTTSK